MEIVKKDGTLPKLASKQKWTAPNIFADERDCVAGL
jgi:hypothetical protein